MLQVAEKRCAREQFSTLSHHPRCEGWDQAAVGKVILVPFPFSDLSESKLRPALILADAGRGDWVLCQITSKPYGDQHAISITDESFMSGSLRVGSFARPGKLFTASSGLVLGVESWTPTRYHRVQHIST